MIYLYISLIDIVVAALLIWILSGKGGGAGAGLAIPAVWIVSTLILVAAFAGWISTVMTGSLFIGAIIFIVAFIMCFLWLRNR